MGKISNKKKMWLLAMVLVVAAIVGWYLWEHSLYESTDDAFVTGNPISLVANVSGHIVDLKVENNQKVAKGDTILIIDQSLFVLALEKATLEKNLAIELREELRRGLQAQQAQLDNAAKNLRRYENIAKKGGLAKATLDGQKTKVEVLSEAVAAKKIKLNEIDDKIALAEVALRQARLDSSYTVINAPQDGVITKSALSKGSFVRQGVPFCSLVSEKKWVVANFKETQIENMRLADEVEISVDAYPDEKFLGKVQSFQAGTGSVFSLLPPQNASGNFVKVVQRVPVKIVFEDAKKVDSLNIFLGMSVTAKVRVKR